MLGLSSKRTSTNQNEPENNRITVSNPVANGMHAVYRYAGPMVLRTNYYTIIISSTVSCYTGAAVAATVDTEITAIERRRVLRVVECMCVCVCVLYIGIRSYLYSSVKSVILLLCY